MTASADVIVAGGGPAGSATAAALARAGCRVVLFEREVFPRRKPCGDYVNPGAAAALDRLGVRDAVVRSGARPVGGMHVAGPRGDAATLWFADRPGWSLPRRVLDAILLAEAARAGVRVYEGATVAAVARQGPRMTVAVQFRGRGGAEAHTAALVVGADGLRSAVARAAGIEGASRRGRYTVGSYVAGLAPLGGAGGLDVGEIHLRPDRYCGVAYLPGGIANVTLALGRAVIQGWRGKVREGYWRELLAFPGLCDRLGRARQAAAVAGAGPLAYRRRRCVADGIMLVGDAATYIDPLTGQGVYLALRGAELAVPTALRALDGAGPRRAALAAYERRRDREFAGVLMISRVLQRLAFHPALAGRALRRLAARPDLGTALIAAVGNAAEPRSVLRPGFVARALGVL